jgi:hypothetical protein
MLQDENYLRSVRKSCTQSKKTKATVWNGGLFQLLCQFARSALVPKCNETRRAVGAVFTKPQAERAEMQRLQNISSLAARAHIKQAACCCYFPFGPT